MLFIVFHSFMNLPANYGLVNQLNKPINILPHSLLKQQFSILNTQVFSLKKFSHIWLPYVL